eukprot:CAMPEP_0178399826 /NCGR_PEP_ID=MMETSP0689_2-20121128/15477_1 /TAXON_ID=160604 /ORGANISM="Amphidinium massartii, Strain CS-259" /LENGTH=166 /DNA_ID=CAMNT_0020020609 /DNA_START=113 /DNA_END=614 /DNA_ORIENTATION=-
MPKTGTARNWNDDKGFGFITPDDGGEDVFCHRTALQDGAQSFSDGDKVEYDEQFDDRKGKTRASNVYVLGGGGGGGGVAVVAAMAVTAMEAVVAIVVDMVEAETAKGLLVVAEAAEAVVAAGVDQSRALIPAAVVRGGQLSRMLKLSLVRTWMDDVDDDATAALYV